MSDIDHWSFGARAKSAQKLGEEHLNSQLSGGLVGALGNMLAPKVDPKFRIDRLRLLVEEALIEVERRRIDLQEAMFQAGLIGPAYTVEKHSPEPTQAEKDLSEFMRTDGTHVTMTGSIPLSPDRGPDSLEEGLLAHQPAAVEAVIAQESTPDAPVSDGEWHAQREQIERDDAALRTEEDQREFDRGYEDGKANRVSAETDHSDSYCEGWAFGDHTRIMAQMEAERAEAASPDQVRNDSQSGDSEPVFRQQAGAAMRQTEEEVA